MGEGMGSGQQGAFASSVNLPEPEKTVSTLAAAAFFHPTVSQIRGVVDGQHQLVLGPKRAQVEAHGALVVRGREPLPRRTHSTHDASRSKGRHTCSPWPESCTSRRAKEILGVTTHYQRPSKGQTSKRTSKRSELIEELALASRRGRDLTELTKLKRAK